MSKIIVVQSARVYNRVVSKLKSGLAILKENTYDD